MSKENLFDSIKQCIEQSTLISAVLSSPLSNGESEKISVRPLQIKGQLSYQITAWKLGQAFHKNLSPDECQAYLEKVIPLYKQTVLFTAEADYHILANKKGNVTVLRKKPTKAVKTLTHNRQKEHFLQEGTQVPFLIRLGIMDSKGRVFAKMMHKFRQINRFVEMIADVIPHLDRKRKINIIDFGCGKAYLTFALYHYLKVMEGFDVSIHGLDLKEKVIQECQQLANELGYKELQFSLGDIKEYSATGQVDMVVSLHACDTATDAALAKAMGWKAGIILCVPCCQHELFGQVENKFLQPLLKHGILKERFAALATDAARAQVLEIAGYQTQVMEFIDLEHTPKNLLIRAIRRQQLTNTRPLEESYKGFKEALKITPALDVMIS